MNVTEKKMLEIVKRLKEDFGLLAVKAEFEAEGTRTEELLRLLEIANKANIKVALKIGGCEAVRDLIESKNFGCNYIIAPMIESAYGLQKFIDAKNNVYSKNDSQDCEFLFNMETISAYNDKDKIFEVANGELDGAVFGRVDFTGSMGLDRDAINNDEITDYIKVVARMSKQNELDFVVGGGVSMYSLPTLSEIKNIYLSRFETRKLVFDAGSINFKGMDRSLVSAVQFELLWLENKRSHYETIFKEDDKRIEMLQKRWKTMLET
jgi:hypothetical protein